MSKIAITEESSTGPLFVEYSEEPGRKIRIKASIVSSFLGDVYPLGVRGEGPGEYDGDLDEDLEEIWAMALAYES